MARHRPRNGSALPQALVRLIHAARKSGTDSEGADISGAVEALRELGALALWALPIHGVFVANNDEIAVIVARIAKQHLGLKEAKREFHDALSVVEAFKDRDPIESALSHIQSVSDEAYFYTGLAFGITLSDFS